MGKIFYIMGKSSTGKDTIYRRIRDNKILGLHSIVPYTTRPIRAGETEGVEYHFVTEEGYEKLHGEGLVVESRVYHTVHGDWRYFTVDDKDVNLNEESYIAIGVLDSFVSIKNYYGDDKVIPILVEVDDGVRLSRALARETKQDHPKYKEMCRRFLSDADDFSDEKIKEAGIFDENRFENVDLDDCISSIEKYIQGKI